MYIKEVSDMYIYREINKIKIQYTCTDACSGLPILIPIATLTEIKLQCTERFPSSIIEW